MTLRQYWTATSLSPSLDLVPAPGGTREDMELLGVIMEDGERDVTTGDVKEM